MNRLIGPILSLLLCGLIAVTASANPTGTKPSPLKIGAILTLSGNFAAAGEDSRRGIEAALSLADNSERLQVQYEDSRNEPSVAVSEFQKLANVDRVVAVYTHRSSIGMALDPISLKSKLPLLGAVGHQDFASTNAFAVQVWPRAHDEGAFVAYEFQRRKYKRVAVLYTEDEWTNSVTEGFRKKLKELGIDLVFEQSVLPGENDFRTQLLKLKAATPDAIYFNFLLPQIALALTQSRAANVQGEVFGNFYLGKKEVRDAAGAASLENVRYVELDNSLSKLKTLLGRGESPPGLAVASFVSTLLLVQASQETPQPKNATELMAALARQKEVRTPDGTYPIEERCIQFPLAVKVMKNGEFVTEKLAG